MDLNRLELESLIYADYFLKEGSGEDFFLLLHGYNQGGEEFYSQIEKAIPKDASVLAPNAMFPMPEREGDAYRVGFSWYFYDHFRDFYFMDQKPAVHFLKNLLKALSWTDRPCKILAYSQGAYLAPFFCRAHSPVASLIGMGCRFVESLSASDFPKELVQINGAHDKFVDCDRAFKSFERLRREGLTGQFVRLEDSGHRLDESFVQALAAHIHQK